MRFSFLGFNQEEAVVKAKLNFIDLTILDYIIQANGNPKMKHVVDEDGVAYVWLYHQKILEDLPVLGITESTLRNRLNNLKERGWIMSVSVRNGRGSGSKSYYSVTEKCIALRYSDDTNNQSVRCHSTVTSKEDSCHSTMTSNNQLYIDNKLKDISKDISADTSAIVNNLSSDDSFSNTKDKPKRKKRDRYEQYMDIIDKFTDNEKLKEALKEYADLWLRLKVDKKGKPLFANRFSGAIHDLLDLSTDIDMQCRIIRKSVRNNWIYLYEYKNENNSRPNQGLQMTEQDATAFKDGKEAKEYTDNLIKENERRGRRAVF